MSSDSGGKASSVQGGNVVSAAKEEMRFNYLLHELAECRQDDRDSITQILSVIAAGVAAVVIVVNVLTNGDGCSNCGTSGNPVMDAFKAYSPWILFGIVAAAFSYVLTLGLRSSLRYSYMKIIYKELETNCGINFPGWVEISAPLITLNPKHIKSYYTLMHFMGTTCAITSAVAVCGSIIAISTVGGGLRWWILGVLTLFFFVFAKTVAAMSDANAMMSKIEMLAKARRDRTTIASRMAESKDVRWLGFAMYLIYPHPQDLLKPLFVAFGFFLGWFIVGCDLTVCTFICRIVLVFVVFDVLGYQARYQINDIRGYHEDERNPAAAKRGRLASFGVPEPVAVRVSAAVAIAKIAAGIAAISLASPGDMRSALAVSFALIFVLALAYEHARSPWKGRLANGKLHKFLPLGLVGLGYALRIAAGIACGGGADILGLNSMALLAIVLVVAAAVPFGWSFVGITWMLECCAGRYKTGAVYHKPHIESLYGKALGRCQGSFDPALRYLPFNRRDSFKNIWNWGLVVSTVLMIVAALLLRLAVELGVPAERFGLEEILVAASVVLLLVGLVNYLVCPNRAKIGFAAMSGSAVIGVALVVWFVQDGALQCCAYPAVLLGAAIYVSICFGFKRTNYFKMADFAKELQFAFVFYPRAAFGFVFRWPKGEKRARAKVMSAKERLDKLNICDCVETSETKERRTELEKDLASALMADVAGFKTGEFL